VVNTRRSRRPHPTTATTNGLQPKVRSASVQGNRVVLTESQLDVEFAEYRQRVTALFADHRHLHGRDGRDTCTCGARWPCLKEEIAAWLLADWV
jgi:hypothetical protein